MKNLPTLLIVSLLVATTAQAQVSIDEFRFPDANFRNYVKANFDLDSDGTLSTPEMNSVKHIDVSRKNISNLNGIELFPSYKHLNAVKTESQT